MLAHNLLKGHSGRWGWCGFGWQLRNRPCGDPQHYVWCRGSPCGGWGSACLCYGKTPRGHYGLNCTSSEGWADCMLLSRKLCFHYSEKEIGRQKGDCGPDAGKYRPLPSGIPYKGNKGKSPYPSSSVLWLRFGISAYHRNAQKGFWINGYKKKKRWRNESAFRQHFCFC